MEQEQFKKEILPLREKLFLYARRLLDNPEDAEDVMQEVFLKLWYMRGGFSFVVFGEYGLYESKCFF